MRLEDQRPSQNIEDRRGMGGRGMRVGGGIGIGGLLIAVVAMFMGVDPRIVLGLQGGAEQITQSVPQKPRPVGAPNHEMGRFVARVIGSTEDTWRLPFEQQGGQYGEPRLVLYEGGTRTACGFGTATAGPFCCPPDRTVYLDTSLFKLLSQRFRAPGDFAQAYVIAHEVGHHVQNQLGIMAKMQEMRPRLSESQNNAPSVRVELQADCFAGVWAYHAQKRGQIEVGDVEEALRAASDIGDDTLRRASQRRIVPESFTHGTAEKRVRWFRTGLRSGTMVACNTFEATTL
ncbi:MAG: neutral zinc metallopeptidase [Burkholderiales bacterium]|nr:neutral zinc metallopeptidase [Burkholderiales bacterium]